MPDTNVKNAVYSGGNTQWYYFAVTNMRAGVEYTLNIVNLVKSDSLYRQGMQPALFSTKDYQVARHVGFRVEGWGLRDYQVARHDGFRD